MGLTGWGPVDPPLSVRGQAAPLRAAQVTVVNADDTVDVRLLKSRAGRHQVPVVTGLTLAAGDRVIVTDLDGDPNTPVVIAALP